jgi:hypothetical protein
MITLVVVFRLLTVLREILTVIAKDIRLVSIASTLTSVTAGVGMDWVWRYMAKALHSPC